MRINERLFGYRVRDPFLFLDYLLWLFFDFSKFKTIKKDKIKKILIIHTGAIGEIVIITPIIKALSDQLGCKIDCLVKKSMFELLENDPAVNKLIPYSGDFNEMLRKIKEEKYDLAVIFQSSFKHALLCYKAGIKYRVGGFSRIKRFPTFLYTRRTFPVGLKHSLDYSFEIIKKIGVKKPLEKKTELYIPAQDENKVKMILKKNRIRKYALIHPGFGPSGKKSPPRNWQDKNYAKVADYLIDKKGLKIIFTGLEQQKDVIDKIIDLSKNKKEMKNFAGKTSLLELCALIKRARLVLAPDTGASHIAASLGVPLVNLMDAPVEEWSPVGSNKKIKNIHHPREIALFEKGNLYSKVGGIKSIEPKEVIDEIKKLRLPN